MNLRQKAQVVSHTITDVDVFTIVNDDANKNAFINYIHVKNGTINQSFTYEYKRKLEESRGTSDYSHSGNQSVSTPHQGDNRALRNGMEAERCNLLRTPEETKSTFWSCRK